MPQPPSRSAAAGIALTYAAIGFLWILGSDWLLSPSHRLGLATAKGLGFVAASAGLIYLLVHRYQRTVEQREAELRESNDRFQRLADQAPDIIYRYRGVPDRAMEYISPAATRLLGYEPADFYADPDFHTKLMDPADAEVLEASRLRADGQPVIMRMKARDGRTVWLENQRVTLTEGGEPVAVEGIARDITERQRLEEQLRQAQKLEAVGQLTGGVAHDFNNILSIILANAELLLRDLPPELVTQRADLEDIRTAARRGASLVAKLLGFSRRAELRLRRVDPRDLVEGLSSMLRRVTPENVTFTFDLGQEPVVVLADPGALEQVLINLVTNARDAMPEGGRLGIGVHRVHRGEGDAPESLVPGDYAAITVSDTGTGMDRRTQSRIFEPFFTTKPAGKGTGLGLPMVYGTIRQLNGDISVQSEVGKGTTFTVYLPAVSGVADRTGQFAVPTREHGGETILLVEDELLLRRAGQRALESFGYRVLTAGDGEEALEIVRAGDPPVDLVISDAVMPRLGGQALYQRLRQEGSRVRFMLASGYSAGEPRAPEALDDSIPVLAKPWTLTDMAQRVRAVLDG